MSEINYIHINKLSGGVSAGHTMNLKIRIVQIWKWIHTTMIDKEGQ